MPKARKGAPPFVPSVRTLLRDANPTWYEIDGEPDPLRRAANVRARDRATAELMRLYRHATAGPRPWSLDPGVWNFCEALTRNDPQRAAKALRARTGAPSQAARRVSIAVDVAREIRDSAKGHGSVGRAIAKVAESRKCTVAAVRKIYLQSDPEWKEAIAASLSLQDLGRQTIPQDA